jgi:hypothetical protein
MNMKLVTKNLRGLHMMIGGEANPLDEHDQVNSVIEVPFKIIPHWPH